MATIIILDYCSASILFIRLNENEIKNLDKFDGNVEEYMIENGLEEKFNFRLKDSHWMFVEDTPEIYYCYPHKNQSVQMFPIM